MFSPVFVRIRYLLESGLYCSEFIGGFFVCFLPHGMWDLSSPASPAVEAWSLNHWTAGESPEFVSFKLNLQSVAIKSFYFFYSFYFFLLYPSTFPLPKPSPPFLHHYVTSSNSLVEASILPCFPHVQKKKFFRGKKKRKLYKSIFPFEFIYNIFCHKKFCFIGERVFSLLPSKCPTLLHQVFESLSLHIHRCPNFS